MREPLQEAVLEGVLESVARLEPEAQTLLVAVSGGSDSVALLHLLLEGPYRLHVAHFDHALRPDSAEDAAFVGGVCAALELPFHTTRAEVARVAAAKGWNVEDAARRLRYSFFTRTAKRVGADAVVTGHTRDDQAETVLMQLLRGAAFLRGMREKRGRVVRPLLNVARADLLAYLDGIDQPYLTDPTNVDTTRTRAWLRYEVLPLLRSRYPNVTRTLAGLAALQRDQETHFARESESFLEGSSVPVASLQRADAALQRQVVAQLLIRAHLQPDAAHIETVRRALRQEHPQRISLPKGYAARVAYGRLELLPPASPESTVEPKPSLPLELPPEVDPDRLASFPDLVIRTRRPGDRVRLSGGTKKLSDLLIDHKVPREDRDALRVLASGSEALWVEGVATDVRVAQAVEDADVGWMKEALVRAREAAARGELPVGAVVVRDGSIIGAGANTTEAARDPTGHAELHALRAAGAALGDWRLTGCTLYVTLEPCPMCFGAALQAHLPRLVYGAPNNREGALGSVADLREAPWKRSLEVRGGVLGLAAGSLLSAFFKSRR